MGNNTDAEIYCISMFHQLHCLVSHHDDFHLHWVNPTQRSLKAVLDEARYGQKIGVDAGHLDHCIDYIRQVSCIKPPFSDR